MPFKRVMQVDLGSERLNSPSRFCFAGVTAEVSKMIHHIRDTSHVIILIRNKDHHHSQPDLQLNHLFKHRTNTPYVLNVPDKNKFT